MFQRGREIDDYPVFSFDTTSDDEVNEGNFSFPMLMGCNSEVENLNLPLNNMIGNDFFGDNTSAFFPPATHLDKTPDFEFDMSSVEPEVSDSNASPADELFFKGQLLPLHLPPRLQMVQSLCCMDEAGGIELANEDDKSDSFSFKACDLNHKHSDGCFCSPDTFSPDFLWRDSRSSSLSSQLSSFWDSGDKDSLDSSYRDSNGSSQDSYISGKDVQPEICMGYRSKHLSENQNMFRLSNCHSQHHNQQSSWLRTPFRWKSLLGSKKASQIKLNSARSAGQKSSNGDKRKATVSNRSYDSNSLGLSSPFLMSSFLVSEKSVRQTRRNSSRNFQTMCNSTNNKILERNHADGKAYGGWNRYMKALKQGTSSAYVEPRVSEKRDPWQLYDRQVRMDILDASRAKSSTAEGTFERMPSCSFLSGNLNLRISSFSRRSSTPTSRANSSQSSPNHSGVLVPGSGYNDTMTELHSAIQGAIAHCKQSQPQPSRLPQMTISKILHSSSHL